MSDKYEPIVVDAATYVGNDFVEDVIKPLYMLLRNRVYKHNDILKVYYVLLVPYGISGHIRMPDDVIIDVVFNNNQELFTLLPNWNLPHELVEMPVGYEGYVTNFKAEQAQEWCQQIQAVYCEPEPVNTAIRLIDYTLSKFPPFSTTETIYRYGPAHVVIDDYCLTNSAIKLCMLETEKTLVTLEAACFDGKKLTKGQKMQVLSDIYVLLEQLLAIPEEVRLLP